MDVLKPYELNTTLCERAASQYSQVVHVTGVCGTQVLLAAELNVNGAAAASPNRFGLTYV